MIPYLPLWIMSVKRKILFATVLLVFSTTSLFIMSHKVFLTQEYSSRRPHKNAILQHVVLGHLAQGVVEAQLKKTKNAAELVRNRIPPSVQVNEAVPQHFGNNSSLMRRQNAVRNSPLRQDSLGFPAEKLAKSSPIPRETDKCLLAPKCLQENDLGPSEMERLTKCNSEAVLYMKLRGAHSGNNISPTGCSCHLRTKKSGNRRMALVSLPGSGNTWVRGLLERVTNICTGSMWCDPNLRATNFCAEGLHSPRTLVVKNHDPTIRWRGEVLPRRTDLSENNKPEFDGAIFVHRNPFDAIVADRNREVGYALYERAVKENRTLGDSVSHHVQSFGVEYFSKLCSNQLIIVRQAFH